MSPIWSAEAAAQATGGSLQGPHWQATGVSIDSRTLNPGDLFVALTDQRDGHDFVAKALASGAVAALVARRPSDVSIDAPLLIVDDVQIGLEALGRAGRARMTGKVIAVTGSAGKTTTKEMLRAALSPQGSTHASVASYNNHWGVPLTLARMPAETQFAIIEIGMNAPGEIAPLSEMARPHVALVTTVAAAHLAAFKDLGGIAHEKASIFHGLLPGGTAIFNVDLETTDILRETAEKFASHLVGFGADTVADLNLNDVHLSDAATVGRLCAQGRDMVLKLPVPGQHLAMNATAALAAVDAVGGDLARALLALAQWTPVEGRGRRERILLSETDDAAVELIDDAYNANPASVAAGLEVLAAATPEGRGRRIAILGDMLELGPSGPDLHAGLADLTAMAGIDLVHCCGPLMAQLHAALPAGRRGLMT
ncbi:MAG: UDP-N-acetylmuramoyl-tripeptide--D-alanyl-D-alanine ligase, partial [Pseudomonadota bacterium]